VNAIERQLRGPEFSNVLKLFDINPKRYWLLMDLFHMLSARGEQQGELGRQKRALRVSFAWFLLFGTGAALLGLLIYPRAWVLASIVIGLTMYVLMSVLLSEAASSLVNPEEALSLSHQPINGATYTAAKLSHLLGVVFYTVMGWNLVPALLSPFFRNGRWFYPVVYLTVAMTAGILLALFCCSIFGLAMRVVPARRMKSAAQFIQAIPIVIFSIFRFSPPGTLRRTYTALVTAITPLQVIPGWMFGLAGAGLGSVVIVTGLRSLSADYLIRASTMAHGHSSADTRIRRSVLGEFVRLFFGGQIGRAGFDYTKRLMLRDWQFRRRLFGLLPLMIGLMFGIARAGLKSPFDSGFSITPLIPQGIGFFTYMTCMIVQYGNDYKGVWLFQLVADRAYGRFARGVHAALWLFFIAAPYVLTFPVFSWIWGIEAAVAFLLYGVACSSLYLAFGLRAIEGVPFGKQNAPGRDTAGQGSVRFFLMVFVVLPAAGVQYLVFRSAVSVGIAIVVLGVAALGITRWSLSTFETAIRHHINTTSQISSMLYTEM
jgi:hypothetical protein